MRWLLVMVDGIGERFALMLVASVWLLTLGVVAILGERVNADSLAVLRSSGREEVIGMQRSHVLALALCAGCAAGDPAGGSSLLPTSDAAMGTRAPVPVMGDDASALEVAGPDVQSPDVQPPADRVAPTVDQVSPDSMCSARYMFPPGCAMPAPGADRDCGLYRAPGLALTVSCHSYELPEVPKFGGRICYGMPAAGPAGLYVASCADCTVCGWTAVQP